MTNCIIEQNNKLTKLCPVCHGEANTADECEFCCGNHYVPYNEDEETAPLSPQLRGMQKFFNTLLGGKP